MPIAKDISASSPLFCGTPSPVVPSNSQTLKAAAKKLTEAILLVRERTTRDTRPMDQADPESVRVDGNKLVVDFNVESGTALSAVSSDLRRVMASAKLSHVELKVLPQKMRTVYAAFAQKVLSENKAVEISKLPTTSKRPFAVETTPEGLECFSTSVFKISGQLYQVQSGMPMFEAQIFLLGPAPKF